MGAPSLKEAQPCERAIPKRKLCDLTQTIIAGPASKTFTKTSTLQLIFAISAQVVWGTPLDGKLWELRLKTLKTTQGKASPGTEYGSSGVKDSTPLNASRPKAKAP